MKQFLKFTLASCLGFLLSFIAISIISVLVLTAAIAGFSSSEKVAVSPNSVLKIELQGILMEQVREIPFYDSWSESITEHGLHDITASIRAAKTDNNIVGIWLQIDLFSAGYASINEIRDALTDFKESGKFIVAYGDNYSQELYYLATVADEIFIHPSGSLEWKGLASKPVFFKNTLDKLGISMQVVKVGDYKGAPDAYTRTSMSDQNKLQTGSILNQFWNKMRNVTATERNIPAMQLDEYASASMVFAPTKGYVNKGLVDSLLYADELIAYFQSRIDSSFNEEKQVVSYSNYLLTKTNNTQKKDKIAVLYVNGGIDDGSIDGIDSKKLAKLLATTRKNNDIKAVVLRINSPGGSAFGAERIWRETSLYKGVKPLVVSMGDYAASGGYYIATQADTIFSQAETITGSIGIFGIIPNLSGLSEKIGVSYDVQSTHALADFPSLTREMTEHERMIMEKYITENYNLFLKRCYEGRSMTPSKTLSVAGGRVWTGSDALHHGLVDKIGGLQQAIQSAADLASITTYEIEYLPKKKNMWDSLLEDTQIRIQSFFAKGIPLNEYKLIRMFIDNKAAMTIQARMEENFEIW